MSGVNPSGSTASGARVDFIGHSGSASINDTEQQAQYDIRREFQVSTGSTTPVGQVLYTLNLDTSIDDNVKSISHGYEYFTFRNLMLYCQSTSPAGTSSGGIQVCHITDPDNVQFQSKDIVDPIRSSGQFNVHKAVRQEGSLLIRPRESIELSLDIEGWLYTYRDKEAKSRRFTSFGCVVMVLRDPPATSDQLAFTITLTGKAVFARTTMSPAGLTVEESVFRGEELELEVVIKRRVVRLFLPGNSHRTLRLERPVINNVRFCETLFFVNGVYEMAREDFIKWIIDEEVEMTEEIWKVILQGINKITGDLTFMR